LTTKIANNLKITGQISLEFYFITYLSLFYKHGHGIFRPDGES